MKLSLLAESVEIMYYDPENFDNSDLDPYDVADKAEMIAIDCGIRIMRNKELKFVALDNSYSDPVVGGLWTAIYHDSHENAEVYEFDVVVDKEFRGQGRIGLKLIDAALDDYRSLDVENKYISVWVVNPKLARVLERKYGFKIEADHLDGSLHMVYYG